MSTASPLEGAHFLRVKWSATKTTSMAALIVAATLCLIRPLQAAPQPLQTQTQPVAGAVASTSVPAAAIAGPPPKLGFGRRLAAARGPPQFRQQELDGLEAELAQLESQPSRELASCARWYQLNQRLDALAGPSRPQRAGELAKKAECDTLDRFYAETRAKIVAFKRLLGQQNEQLDFAVSLTNEYLDLKYAASVNQQLAAEFEAAQNADSQTRYRASQLEQFIQFMGSSLGAAAGEQQSAPQSQLGDELDELDAALKRLVNSELSLGPQDFQQLLELSAMLERILADGHVDLGSGRFRYLLGTLDAAQTVILHHTGSSEAGPAPADPESPAARPPEVPRAVQLRRQARTRRPADVGQV